MPRATAPLDSTCLRRARAGLAALLGGRTRVLVAVSGGPDSQALLDCCARLAAELGLVLWACGIDHGLRAEAHQELALAEGLAARHGIPYHAVRLGPLPRGNRLAAARAARLRELGAVARRVGAQAIALGHHQGDQAETLLMHLIRGCGPAGMAGMPARRGALVRPLLAASRADILGHLAACDIPFARDPSNHATERTRTQLREVVLPALGRINPQAIAHLAQAASAQRPVADSLARAARRLLAQAQVTGPAGEDGRRLRVAPLHRASALTRKGALLRWLRQHGIVPARARLEQVAALCAEPSSDWSAAPVCLRGGHVVRRGAELHVRDGRPTSDVQRSRTPWQAHELPLAALGARPNVLRVGGHVLAAWQHVRQAPAPEGAGGAQLVAFAASALHCGVSLRPWQPGDKLRLSGSRGHAQVSDLFQAARVPRALRSAWPILVHDGEVLWVAGIKRAPACAPRFDGAATVWFEHRCCPAISPSTPGENVV